jgi:hypothetical protein
MNVIYVMVLLRMRCGKHDGRGHLGDLDIEGRILLTWILRK